MNQKKKTVTIGIPAFNEEGSIVNLIKSLLIQERDGFILKKIVISSDGSEDNTVQAVRTFKNKLIKIIDNKDRQGQGARQNQIVKLYRTDVLVLINADMVIKDRKFLKKLVGPIIRGQSDLTAANFEPTPSDGFFDRIITTGLNYKKSVYEGFQNGNNWYTCRGAARAFSRRFYSKLNFKRSVGEDLYTYLLCTSLGWKYRFVKGAVIYGKMPTNFTDHKRQSSRFFSSGSIVQKEFNPEFLKKYCVWPMKQLILQGLKMLLTHPVEMFLYPLIVILVKVFILLDREMGESDIWQVAKSSKIINV